MNEPLVIPGLSSEENVSHGLLFLLSAGSTFLFLGGILYRRHFFLNAPIEDVRKKHEYLKKRL